MSITPRGLVAIVREFFPRATASEAVGLLWERTPYPFSGDAEQYRASLRTLKQTVAARRRPCDLCNAPIGRGRKYMCGACRRALA